MTDKKGTFKLRSQTLVTPALTLLSGSQVASAEHRVHNTTTQRHCAKIKRPFKIHMKRSNKDMSLIRSHKDIGRDACFKDLTRIPYYCVKRFLLPGRSTGRGPLKRYPSENLQHCIWPVHRNKLDQFPHLAQKGLVVRCVCVGRCP